MVATSLTKNASVSCRQEALLALLRICDFLGELFGRACHLGLLAMVWTVLLRRNAFLGKGKLDSLQILVSVQSDLDTTRAFADTAEVVLVQVHVDYLFGS